MLIIRSVTPDHLRGHTCGTTARDRFLLLHWSILETEHRCRALFATFTARDRLPAVTWCTRSQESIIKLGARGFNVPNRKLGIKLAWMESLSITNHAILVSVVLKLWLNFNKVKLFTISSCSRFSSKGSKVSEGNERSVNR